MDPRHPPDFEVLFPLHQFEFEDQQDEHHQQPGVGIAAGAIFHNFRLTPVAIVRIDLSVIIPPLRSQLAFHYNPHTSAWPIIVPANTISYQVCDFICRPATPFTKEAVREIIEGSHKWMDAIRLETTVHLSDNSTVAFAGKLVDYTRDRSLVG